MCQVPTQGLLTSGGEDSGAMPGGLVLSGSKGAGRVRLRAELPG